MTQFGDHAVGNYGALKTFQEQSSVSYDIIIPIN